MCVINVTFFSTTFCFSINFIIKRKISKITFWVRNPEKISFIGGKNEKLRTQGVKAYKNKTKKAIFVRVDRNLIKP